ncbi:MAG: hypothetical protein ACTS73_04540 [Arsenophonus sp. NEOnobi-MAG3]
MPPLNKAFDVLLAKFSAKYYPEAMKKLEKYREELLQFISSR